MSNEIKLPGGVQDIGWRIGPLLYTPGLRTDMAEKFARYSSSGLKSAAVCLEDTVRDDMVAAAEKNAVSEIKRFAEEYPRSELNIFIRVREPSQIGRLSRMLGDIPRVMKGFIIPKIDDVTVEDYLPALDIIRGAGLRLMPILENTSLLDISGRERRIGSLRDTLLSMEDCIANVRLGGNDLCNGLGVLCPVNRTIYDIPPIAGLLSDLAAALTPYFIVSAPVWNYFGEKGGAWQQGLEREMETDRLMGFVGKTIIHPCQIAPALEGMKVTRNEYEDALAVVSSKDSEIQVIKRGAESGFRMYEAKVHTKWAEKILRLGDIYGIREEHV